MRRYGTFPLALGLSLLTLLSLLLNTVQLGSQPVSGDDFSVAISAINYMESGQLGPTMWNHPCLRNILVYWALRLFGTGVVGAKGVSVLMGTLCTPLVGMIAFRLSKQRTVALVAAFLWAIDALVVDFSRQGINDIYLAFFPLAGIYLALRFRESGNHLWLVAAGAFFGLGLASKWSVAFPLFATLVLLAVAHLRERRREGGSPLGGYFRLSVLLVVLPALVYLLTFLPWLGRGYSLSEWGELQRSMFLETSQHTGYRPKPWDDHDHRAWRWFVAPSVFVDPFVNMDLLERPGAPADPEEAAITVVLGYANPLVWFLVLPAVAALLIRGIRTRDEGTLYLTGIFLVSYLPLALSTRPIWMNTSLSVLPYALIAVAWWMVSLTAGSARGKALLAGYLALVVLVAAPLYLLAVGKGKAIPGLRKYTVDRYLTQLKERGSGVAPPAGGSHGTK
ncbi:phospholipid carrier-dependent glycosyltransferase [Geomonas sp. Red32]|uniref:phospholipid carrier-dependent glycosyltransferase n=1 Tax=Geomonas sp. Red32 TaxID=2912856 RepID=UPI00202CF6E1|nr:phospholipid carrier-dependent glycosyltransferase [Geomonas sp. Red32]MCM0080607.1 phospholipid carrier-dependent glycosyltransferase [Geomonas sp. Red32]